MKKLVSFEKNSNAMRPIALLTLIAALCTISHAQVCSPTGNIAVFTNYDGGILNINCDVNIPNLKIGICTYEWCTVNITGPFAGNVTAVRYAGFIGQNNHCGYGVQPITVTGVPTNIVTILFAPPATQSDPNGNPNIICAYQCGPGNQGGCNTSSQVAAYFTSTLSGTLRSYETQYGCWNNVTKSLSLSGCCGTLPPPPAPVASFTVNDDVLCLGQCINFTSTSTGGATSYSWSFPGATPALSTQTNPSNICYPFVGNFTATLIASNANGSSTFSLPIAVSACGVPGCTYEAAENYNPSATVDDGTCEFPDCADATCPGDLNSDGVIGFADLTIFLGAYNTLCP